MSMMFFIVDMFMGVLLRLVAVLVAFVAVGHFLMGVLMLVLVFFAHGLSLPLFCRRPIGKLRPEHGPVFGVFFGAVGMLDSLLVIV